MSTKKDKFSSKDKNYMKLAINLAKARKGLTGENPSVGCVIVKNDKIKLLPHPVSRHHLLQTTSNLDCDQFAPCR